MSLVDNLMPRSRGRPPKVRDPESSALAHALSSPFPPNVLAKAQALVAANETAQTAMDAYNRAKQASCDPELRRRNAIKLADDARQTLLDKKDGAKEAARAVKDAEEALAGAKSSILPRFGLIAEAERALATVEREKASRDARVRTAEETLKRAKAEEAAAHEDDEASIRERLLVAQARRDVAAQLGGDNGPTDGDIAELEEMYAAAKRRSAAGKAMLVALEEECRQRAAAVLRHCDELQTMVAPLRAAWEAAADEQIAMAATLIAQTEQLASLLDGYGDEHNPFRHRRFAGGGDHVGQTAIPSCEELRSVFHALRIGFDRANPRF